MSDTLHTAPHFWGEKRYYSLDYYLKKTFGEKVYRLSLNGGMSCPNRDGLLDSRGCIFCSAGGSGDFAAAPAKSVTEQIAEAKMRILAKSSCQKFIAYFQAYTNTYAPVSYLRRIFTEAIYHPDIVALSIATRFDCLSDEVLDLLAELNWIKPVWIELGIQSMYSATHAFIRSGLDPKQLEPVVTKLRERDIAVIVHLILGLPGETKEMMLTSLARVTELPIQGIKLQLLHVLKGTDLATFYEKEPFPLFTMDEYCNFIVDCLERIPETIVVHRITGDGPRQLLLAPLWSTDKKRVLNTIQRILKERDTWQGKDRIIYG